MEDGLRRTASSWHQVEPALLAVLTGHARNLTGLTGLTRAVCFYILCSWLWSFGIELTGNILKIE